MKRVFAFSFFIIAINSSAARLSLLERADKICAAPERKTFSAEANEELQYLCTLPERVKRNVPEVYWMAPDEYQKWLMAQSEKPSAPNNFGKTAKEGDEAVNRMVLAPSGCHFYSSISPSVQHNKLNRQDPRTKVITDFDDLLTQCRTIATAIESGHPRCSVIEFAGHATQSVGLDSVFGIHIEGDTEKFSPSSTSLDRLGRCLKRIADKNAHVVFSVCGGDRMAGAPKGSGVTHYWPNKALAQKKLSRVFGLPILSGIGFVEGTPEGGVTAEGGWHFTEIAKD